jgi:hypothetical protein
LFGCQFFLEFGDPPLLFGLLLKFSLSLGLGSRLYLGFLRSSLFLYLSFPLRCIVRTDLGKIHPQATCCCVFCGLTPVFAIARVPRKS